MAATYVFLLTPGAVAWVNNWNSALSNANVVIEERLGVLFCAAQGLEADPEAFGDVLQYFAVEGIKKTLFDVGNI